MGMGRGIHITRLHARIVNNTCVIELIVLGLSYVAVAFFSSQENLGMTTALKIALGVVLVMTMGEAMTDLESIVRDMRMEMNEMKDKLELLELKSEPVYIHTCGSHDRSISSIDDTITYLRLLYSSTNTEVGGLDISSGLFSSPHPGTYMVTWTLIAYNFYPDEAVIVSLHKNNEIIRESRTYSSNSHMYAQGKSHPCIIIMAL